MPNNLTQMAKNILQIESDLPYRFNYKNDKYDHPTVDDFEIYIFQQIWGSTALGFGGIGGQAMTSTYTYVFVPVNSNQNCFVYFDGEFAYEAPYSDIFMEDVAKHRMEPVHRKGKYYEQFKNKNKQNSN